MLRKWNEPIFEELNVSETMKTNNNNGNGNNDTNTHKGWCEMHKHPGNGICTYGAGAIDRL